MRRSVVIGTRGSRLARAQTDWVAGRLLEIDPDLAIEIRVIESNPASASDAPLLGDGIFVKHIQSALLAGEADLAVHSLKDLPTAPVPGLTLGAIPQRADPREALVGSTLAALPPGAVVGTSSPRRSAQLRSLRSDLLILPLAGNVSTRIKRVKEGEFAAAMLAAAGLYRLGLEADDLLPLDRVLPAPGQGALAIEIRTGEAGLARLTGELNDPETSASVRAERGLLQQLGGGCLLPVSALGRVVGGRLWLQGCVISQDGGSTLWADGWGDPRDPMEVAQAVASDLTDLGANELLGVTR
ncbi:MAG: hydroxymethylbilane synthase [Actinomycetota bacterium]